MPFSGEGLAFLLLLTAVSSNLLPEIIEAFRPIKNNAKFLIEFHENDVPFSKQIAEFNGFQIERQLHSFPNVFVAKVLRNRRKKRSLNNVIYELIKNRQIAWAEQISNIHREKRRFIPSNCKQTLASNDSKFTGNGVKIAILDDGVDHRSHKSLHDAFVKDLSFDFTRQQSDPSPEPGSSNHHGTHCSGLIFMNGQCGHGITTGSRLIALKMLSEHETLDDVIEGEALGHHPTDIDIYTSSWGPKDDGRSAERPGKLAEKALRRGVTTGRDGKGSLFIWASGNGGLEKDDCAMDGYASHPDTITFGVIDSNGRPTWYAESCPAILASVETICHSVMTTDVGGRCSTFSGSSVVAPIAAGILAKLLEARKDLTQRDAQHLIVRSSLSDDIRVKSPDLWHKNGAGFYFSRYFGFGVLDEDRLLSMASEWKLVPSLKTCSVDNQFQSAQIPYSTAFEFAACEGTSSEINVIEKVEIHVWLEHPRRGDLSIQLISPSGTEITLLQPRPNDDSPAGLQGWNFVVNHLWGENPRGKWQIHVLNNGESSFGSLLKVRFVVHGT